MSLRSRNTLRLAGAAAVHVLTASGAVLGLLSLLSASEGQWAVAFAWLGAALIVDGVDGPLARLVDVKRVLPRFSGEELDHLVDYLTYVAVPAFMVARAELVPESLRLPLASVIMLVSLYHFSDTESKTADGYFVGFPAIWNVVVLYCFVLDFAPFVSASGHRTLRHLNFHTALLGASAACEAAADADFCRRFSVGRGCRQCDPSRVSGNASRAGHIRSGGDLCHRDRHQRGGWRRSPFRCHEMRKLS